MKAMSALLQVVGHASIKIRCMRVYRRGAAAWKVDSWGVARWEFDVCLYEQTWIVLSWTRQRSRVR